MKIKLKNVYILSLFCFCSLVYSEEIIVLNTTGKPPLNDAEHKGFMDRVAFEAFKRINIKLESVQLPAERALINANTGIIDGEMSRISGLILRYPNLIKVNEKIMDWEFVVYSDKDITIKSSWDSLKPYSVSIINGWKILEKNIPANVDLIKVKNTEQLFGMLNLKRTDLIIYEKWGGLQYLRTNKITNIKLIQPPLIVKEMFIYLNAKHKTLVPRLATVLKGMKQDGTYQKIKNQTLLDKSNF